jgi:hypothetical protein
MHGKAAGTALSLVRELAEELGRFLNQEPILAKPAGVGRKTWSWLVKNPWALTGAAAILVLGLTGLAYGFWEQNRALKWSMAHGRPATPASDWPFNSVMAWGILMLGGGVLVPVGFAGFVNRKRRNLPMTRMHRLVFGAIGAWGVLMSLGLSLRGIQYYCWNGFAVKDIGMVPVLMVGLTVLQPIWFGSLLIWHLARDIRRTSFGLEHPQEQELFPPAPGWTDLRANVSQLQAMNLVYACVMAVIATALIIHNDHMHRSLFTLIAVLAGVAASQFFAWRNSKTANRWMSLSGCVFCAMGSFLFYFLSIEDPPWYKASVALALGLAGGLFVAKMSKRLAINIRLLACQRLLPNVESLCRGTMAGLCLVAVPCGVFLLFPLADGFSCGFILPILGLLIPWQCILWRAAEAAEKRAQGFSLLIWLAASAMIAVYNQWRDFLKAGFIGLAAGFAMVAAFFWLERRAATRLSSKSV